MIEIIVSFFRIILGFVLTLFLPGFAVGLVIFRKDKLDIIERLALSSALSIAITLLMALFLDLLLGISTTASNMIFPLLTLTLLAFLVWSVQTGVLKKRFKSIAEKVVK